MKRLTIEYIHRFVSGPILVVNNYTRVAYRGIIAHIKVIQEGSLLSLQVLVRRLERNDTGVLEEKGWVENWEDPRAKEFWEPYRFIFSGFTIACQKISELTLRTGERETVKLIAVGPTLFHPT